MNIYFIVFLAVSLAIVVTIAYFFLFRKRYRTTNYENSKQIKFKSQIDKEGKKDGEEIIFRPNGKKNKISHWKKDVRDGDFVVYWPNGEKYIVGAYKEGKLAGKYTVYSETGKIIFKANY